ncbi:caspase family protein [Iningainema tapete]|uniref:Caspase family protein n=1 Tax=Iningainema tapete BLCC-T55 TaxID=2748662 RepID=A0A8J7CBR5_9CYAN|nr:caspase family protein [Iningainema tapete]MBD2778651.1 caspase family protein [Iningainema tapete BLCC-T55]
MIRDALVVGINTYSYERLRPLTAPAQDAEAIAKLLERYGQFNVKRIPSVKDKENNTVRVGQKTVVTLNQLEEAIVQLFKPEGKSIPDTALLYFSGHGLRKNRGIQQGFLATSDVNPDSGNWGLSLQWLRQLLLESEVKQQIIWLDCCYSGELVNFAEADPGDRGKGRDRCFIAASREFEVAYEAIGSSHSVLTQALLLGLEPKQEQEQWVTNYTLIDILNQHWANYPQRPIFANSGSAINLTRIWSTQREESVYTVTGRVCPYRGLQYFDCKESDAQYFFGREVLTDQLLEKVRTSNFLAVLGASGSGKSSVVRAGLLYQIKLGRRLSGSENWQIKIFRPGEHPLHSLALAFVDSGLSDIDRASQLAKAEELLAKGGVGLGQLINATDAERVVLVADQFEEAFTLCQNISDRQRFFECLLGALPYTGNKLCIVLTMRADFFGKCAEQEYSGLAQQIQQHLVTVTPMTKEELTEAITAPARKVGLQIQEELVQQIISDVEGSPGSLPLLQYTLTELWQQQQFTLAAYTRLGGVKGTLEKRATEVYESLSREEQLVAKRIFLELTQLGEGTEDTRRRVLLDNLVSSPQQKAVVERVIGKLADENVRLLVTSTLVEKGTESGIRAVVDVAHEALIRNWLLLRQWVAENREALRQQRKIESEAQEWQDNSKGNDYLLQGAKLAQAEDFLPSYGEQISLSSLAQDLIAASRAERERREQVAEESRQRELQQERKARHAAQNTIALVSIVAIFAVGQWIKAEEQFNIALLQGLNTIATISNDSDLNLNALINNVKAGKQLQKVEHSVKVDAGIKMQVLANLHQVIYGVREQNRLIKHDAEVTSVAFSPDSKTLASASSDSTVKLWRTDSSLITTLKHDAAVNSVAFSPDSKTLASASSDKTVKLWRTDGSLITTLKHDAMVDSVAFSPDGKTLASASWDKTVKLWRIDGSLISTLKHDAAVNSVAFSPDGKTLTSASSDKTVKLWRTDGSLITTLKHDAMVDSVAFSPDGKTLASASWDKTVKLWRIDGSLISTLKHDAAVNSVAFSPDGKTLTSASSDKTVKLWRTDGSLITTLKHDDEVYSVAFSPDGKTLASASRDKTVKLWRIDGSLITTLKHDAEVNSVAFSPDGKTLASASLDETVKLWRIDGSLITTLKHDTKVTSVAFSPDGKTLASASYDKTVKLWRIDSSLISTLRHDAIVDSVAFSPDGKTLASASWDKTVKLWRIDGSLISTLRHDAAVRSVAFSPDGKTLASVSYDKTVKLWHSDGSLISTLRHDNTVWDVAFSPDGKTLASASSDKTVKLWHSDGSLISTLKGHDAEVFSVAFSPDGKTLASASRDKTVKLWNFNLDDLLDRSCKWLHDYLKNPDNGMKQDDPDRRVCDSV